MWLRWVWRNRMCVIDTSEEKSTWQELLVTMTYYNTCITVTCVCSQVWNAELSLRDDLQLYSRRPTSWPAALHDDDDTDNDCWGSRISAQILVMTLKSSACHVTWWRDVIGWSPECFTPVMSVGSLEVTHRHQSTCWCVHNSIRDSKI